MKIILRNSAIITCICIFSFVACDKEKAFDSQGIITQADMRMCACCGGYFIDIGESTFRFYELPKFSGIDLENETLPISVYLNYTKDKNACMEDLITIQKIQKK